MKPDLVLVDRDALLVELQQVFDTQTAETLLSVLNKVAAQVYAAGMTREDFSELRAIVAELAEAQRRTEEEVRKLVEAQQKTDEHLSHMDERLSHMDERLSHMDEHLSHMDERVSRLENKVGRIDGRTLEWMYRDKAAAYFGRLLRRPKVVAIERLWESFEPHLSADEINDLLLTDLVIRGKPRQQVEIGEVWLTVEVSSFVDKGDVQRACRRAELLRRAGYRVIPVVAGESTTPGAEAEARNQNVVMLQNGRNFLWDEAYAAWTAST